MLSEEQRMVRDTVRGFVAERMTPYAAEWDRNATFPKDALAELAALGWYGIAVPEHYGGAGLDYLALAILEEIAAGDGATSTDRQRQQLPGVLDPDGLGQTTRRSERWLVRSRAARCSARSA